MPSVSIGYYAPDIVTGARLPARYSAVGYEQISYAEDTSLSVGSLVAVADSIVADLNGFYGGGYQIDIPQRKTLACQKVERRSQEIIATGYKHSDNNYYPLTQEALSRYLIINTLAVGALLSTIVFESIDGNASVTFNLLSLGGAQAFAKSCLATYHNTVNTGFTLKESIRACTTTAQLAAIVDSR